MPAPTSRIAAFNPGIGTLGIVAHIQLFAMPLAAAPSHGVRRPARCQRRRLAGHCRAGRRKVHRHLRDALGAGIAMQAARRESAGRSAPAALPADGALLLIGLLHALLVRRHVRTFACGASHSRIDAPHALDRHRAGLPRRRAAAELPCGPPPTCSPRRRRSGIVAGAMARASPYRGGWPAAASAPTAWGSRPGTRRPRRCRRSA